MPENTYQVSQEEASYQNEKRKLLSKREDFVKRLEATREKYKKIQRSIIPRKEVRLSSVEKQISLFENTVSLIDGQLRFLRPRSDEDISYRNRQYNEFSDRIKEKLPEEVPLRFHGCPICGAEKILESGEISSSVDRIGVETSYDGAGQISVTTRSDLYITVQNYTNLTYDYNLPAGCIFVVTPESLADEESGHQQLMDSVKFKNDPQRLVAVISTPENIPVIRSWLNKIGISSDKAVDFDGFANNIENFIQSVRLSYRDLPHQAKGIDLSAEKPKKPSLDEQIRSASRKAAHSRSTDIMPVKKASHEL